MLCFIPISCPSWFVNILNQRTSLYLLMKDELLWAAAWLYLATNDQYYLKYVVDNAVSLGGTGWAVTEFSWDNKYAGLQVLLTKVHIQSKNSILEIKIVCSL